MPRATPTRPRSRRRFRPSAARSGCGRGRTWRRRRANAQSVRSSWTASAQRTPVSSSVRRIARSGRPTTAWASQQAIKRAISARAKGGTILRGRRTLRRPRKGSLPGHHREASPFARRGRIADGTGFRALSPTRGIGHPDQRRNCMVASGNTQADRPDGIAGGYRRVASMVARPEIAFHVHVRRRSTPRRIRGSSSARAVDISSDTRLFALADIGSSWTCRLSASSSLRR